MSGERNATQAVRALARPRLGGGGRVRTGVLTPKPRGSLSDALFEAMRTSPSSWDGVLGTEPDRDDDAQIALWSLYEMHYRGFEDVGDDLEWQPELLLVRGTWSEHSRPTSRALRGPGITSPFAETFFDYVASHEGRSLASFVQRDAKPTRYGSCFGADHLPPEGVRPERVARPAPGVGPQAALMELQYDEYGAGDPNRLHAHLFARGLEACGLGSGYGAYIDEVPGEVLEQNNAMSLFGLHRRLRGAALGHLAAFEATSSLPSRRMSQGLDRLGFPQEIIDYYDEQSKPTPCMNSSPCACVRHCWTPSRRDNDVFFGAFTCLDLEDRFAGAMLEAWAA